MSRRKDRKDLLRQMADAMTPVSDRIRAWVIKWASITGFLVLLYLLLDAWAGGPR